MKYKLGHRAGAVEVIGVDEGDKYTLICDCGFIFNRTITGTSGLMNKCKRCEASPAKSSSSVLPIREYTDKEQDMIAKFLKDKEDDRCTTTNS